MFVKNTGNDIFDIVTYHSYIFVEKIITSDILISVSAGYVPFGTVTASFNVLHPLVKK